MYLSLTKVIKSILILILQLLCECTIRRVLSVSSPPKHPICCTSLLGIYGEDLEIMNVFFSGACFKLLNKTTLPRASMTGGLVQEFEHSVLPSVTPSITVVCTLLSILVSLIFIFVIIRARTLALFSSISYSF